VKRGLEYADENGYEIVPTCPYVAAYMKKHDRS
jgi:predicted GNAT family acetyltransferase